MKTLALSAVLLATALGRPQAPLPAAAAWTGGKIPMVFSGTDAGHALKAIGLRTGASIVYAAGKDKEGSRVTLNLVARSPEEAIRSVASAAGLAVRRLGPVFVVAPASGMRQALEPYAVTGTFAVEAGAPADLATQLQAALPYAVVRAAGDRLSVVGVPEDVEAARAQLRDLQAGSAGRQPTTDVVPLERAVPAAVAPLLAALFPDVKVLPTPGDRPGGALALSGPRAGVEGARAMAARLDADSGRDGVVLRVYSVRYSSASALAEFLKQAAPNVEAIAGPRAFQPRRATFNPIGAGVAGIVGDAAGGAASPGMAPTAPTPSGPTPSVAEDAAKTLVLRGRAADVGAAVELLGQVDRKPRQVVVEVNVFETSPERSESVGLTYDWTSLSFFEAPGGPLVKDGSSATRPVGAGGISRVPWNFNAKLNAMVTRRQARILARPSVRVVDNGQSSVFIGDTLRARIVTGGALGAQNVEIREFPVGIILLLAPRVNADGNITLHVNPVVSTVTALDEFNVPQTSSREAETTAIVKDGETVVLGGLIRDEDVRSVQEVPLLSKLPFLGELFKNRTRNHRRSDILVSITTHLVPDDETAVKG